MNIKIILILLSIITSNVVFAEDLRLSCMVNGKSSATNMGKSEIKDDVVFKNQKVAVIISIIESDLVIRVEGENRTDVVSTYTMKNSKGEDKIIANYSDKNIYHLKNSFTDVKELPVDIIKDIKIDRVLGRLTVSSTLDVIGLHTSTTSYSGNCSKINNVNKF